MSEQAVALKTAVKAKGKASPLEGLLKAGRLDSKDDKEFVKKLLEMTKKGEIELDKNGSLKLKSTHLNTEELDTTALMNIKSLLSQIKLNDKLAIEKSVKELRDTASKNGNKKDTEVKDLKKLLAMAKDSGVDVKKVSVEKLEDAESKKTDKTTKLADKKHAVEQKIEPQKTDKTEKTEKATPELLTKQAKEPAKEVKKDTPSLASLLQETKAKELPKEGTKELVTAVATSEIKKDISKETKDVERHPKKEAKKESEAKTQLPQKSAEGIASIFKDVKTEDAKSEILGLADFLAKKESAKDESIAKREHVGTHVLEAPKQSDNELKGKMAVASEGLKNFSSDLKETVENYKPPMMKVSMELNPQNLGSVDVTLISRGSNLIVNVSSSQDTMQMFMQNIQEFRQNLMAQGFVSLQMNFNFSDQNKEQNNKNWQKEAAKKYQINNDEIGKIESLDIVIPHPKYA